MEITGPGRLARSRIAASRPWRKPWTRVQIPPRAIAGGYSYIGVLDVLCMSQVLRLDIMLALVAFLCLGLTDFIRKRGSLAGASPVGYLVLETIVLLAILPVASYLLERGLPRFDAGTLTYAPISGVTIAIALLALLYALNLGEGSQVIPIARLGLALATILSLLLLNESITWTKVAGIVLAVAAVFMLSRT